MRRPPRSAYLAPRSTCSRRELADAMLKRALEGHPLVRRVSALACLAVWLCLAPVAMAFENGSADALGGPKPEASHEEEPPDTRPNHITFSGSLGVANGFSTYEFNSTSNTSTVAALGPSVGYLYQEPGSRFGFGMQISALIGYAGVGGSSETRWLAALAEVYGLFDALPHGSFSPYAEVGIGAGWSTHDTEVSSSFLQVNFSEDSHAGGALGEVQVGVEWRRASGKRFQVGFEALLPMYQDSNGDYPLGLLLTFRFVLPVG